MSTAGGYYRCMQCTACCRWAGDVKIDDEEVQSISSFLNMEIDDFIQRYTRLRVNRQGLSIVEKEGSEECVFLTEEGGCLINDVKPQQCRDFPNKWNFPGWQEKCKARFVQTEL